MPRIDYNTYPLVFGGTVSNRKVRVYAVASGTVAAATCSGTYNHTHRRVELLFDRSVMYSSLAYAPSSYAVVVPVGSAPVAVASVSILSSTSVHVYLSGGMVEGGLYTLSVPSVIARAVDNGGSNEALAISFYGVGSVLTISSVVPVSNTQLRVMFSAPVRMVSSSNIDDALRKENYVITKVSPATPLSVISVARYSDTAVMVTTADQEATQYNLVISNVKDLTGNVVTE